MDWVSSTGLYLHESLSKQHSQNTLVLSVQICKQCTIANTHFESMLKCAWLLQCYSWFQWAHVKCKSKCNISTTLSLSWTASFNMCRWSKTAIRVKHYQKTHRLTWLKYENSLTAGTETFWLCESCVCLQRQTPAPKAKNKHTEIMVDAEHHCSVFCTFITFQL